MNSYNYLEKAIKATEECIDLHSNSDETLNVLTYILDRLSSLEIDTNHDLLKYTYRWLHHLCSNIRLEPVEAEMFLDTIDSSNGKEEIDSIGNKILKFQSIKSNILACVKLDPEARKKLIYLYYRTNISINKEDLNYLCREAAGIITKEDIEDFNVQEIIYKNKDRLFGLEFQRFHNQTNCISRNDKARISNILNRFLNSESPNKYEILKQIVTGFINICSLGIGIPEDTVSVFQNFINNFDPKQYDSNIHEFFTEMNNIILSENLPSRNQSASTPREFRDIVRRVGRRALEIDDQDVNLDGKRRTVRTIRRFEPIPIPRRPGNQPAPQFRDQELRRVSGIPDIIGSVHNPRTHGGARMLVRARSNERPSWTGFFHPFVVDNDEYFECGMGCRNYRSPNDNIRIRDACKIQADRRRSRRMPVSKELQQKIDRCDVLLAGGGGRGGRGGRGRSSKRGLGGSGGTSTGTTKRLRRFRSRKKI
jgi:hypothetical protein